MSKDKDLFGCGCEDENCDCGHDELDNSCDCGCGCGDHDEEIMTITLEDGTEVDCAIIAIFPVEEKVSRESKLNPEMVAYILKKDVTA